MMPRHPSGFPVPITNLRYKWQLEAEKNKRPPGDPSVVLKQNQSGEWVPNFIDTRKVPYVMPAFTAEEEKLLGLRPYSAAEMAATDVVLRRLVQEAASGGASGAGVAGAAGGAASDSDGDSDGAGAAAWSSSNGRPGRAGGVGGAGGAGGAQKKVVPASKRSHKASESATESDNATESDSDDNTQAGPPLKKANVQYAWECRKCLHVNVGAAVACTACDTPRGSS